MTYRYKVEFYIYAADMAEFNKKYERMKQIADERGRLLEELTKNIVRVAARVDEELEARGAGKAVEEEYLKEAE